MQNMILYYMFLTLVFGSVFLVINQIVSQKQELFLRLPLDEVAQRKKKDKQREAAKILKVLSPLGKKLLPYIKQKKTERALKSGGSWLTVPEFVAFKILTTFFGFVCGAIIFSREPMYITFFVFCGFMYPDFWLKQKISARHSLIRQDLPNVIDLLNLCVNAGVDFMLAVHKVIKEFKPCPLRDELSEVWRESQIGRSRREALRGLAWRVNLAEVTSFVRTLIQTDKMGAPMGEALRIQAEEIRVRRFQHGEAQAAKAPIKLLIPLMLFIMPVVLVIIAGPIMLQFMRGGISI